MSYFDFNNNIDKTKVKTIFELGSRDLIDAKKLINHYNNAICYSFECNPDCLVECKKNKANFNEDENKRIILIENAVSIENNKVLFRPFDLSIYNNMGASSMLEIDFSMRNKNDQDYNRGKVQKEIEVNGIRIDTYMENNNIQNIDLLCMDLQGYELQAIKSMGEKIKTVKYIITECSLVSTYKNGAIFSELNDYLEKYGFKYNNSNKFGHNFPNLEVKGFSEFDALFINKSDVMGEANFQSDEELVTLLRKKPKHVAELKTKGSFRRFFSCMSETRLLGLLEAAYDGLGEEERQKKVKKRMALVEGWVVKS